MEMWYYSNTFICPSSSCSTPARSHGHRLTSQADVVPFAKGERPTVSNTMMELLRVLGSERYFGSVASVVLTRRRVLPLAASGQKFVTQK